MFTFKLILIFSLQFFGLFGFKFRDSGAKYLLEKFQRATSHLNVSTVQQSWIQLPLDHLSNSDGRTWHMRYFSNMNFYRPGGPIILFIQGESQAYTGYLEVGTAFELARLTGGALFSSEHRYYGQSIPLPVRQTEDLLYLSSVQAMGDLVYLIKFIQSKINAPNAKVVVVGGSYAGNLAAWMRLKYPDLVHAAYASSAPVLAKKNFFEYNQKVSDDYRKYGGEACYNKIQNRFNRYQQLLGTAGGIEQLKTEENICPYSDLTRIENQQLFLMINIISFENTAQRGEPNVFRYNCSTFHSEEFEENLGCNNIDFNIFSTMKYPWIYQVCTEFGYFMTSVAPFTNLVNVDYYVKMCMIMFGPEFNEGRVDEGIARTNTMFEGRSPKISRVVFTNGDADPWSTLGVLQSLSADAPAIVIPDEHHCSDLLPSTPQSVKAKDYAISMIRQWLQM